MVDNSLSYTHRYKIVEDFQNRNVTQWQFQTNYSASSLDY